MKIEIHNRCSDFTSFRAALVKSLFNAEDGCNFQTAADIPLEDSGWQIGVVVGPSGSGKSSIGKALPGFTVYDPEDWPKDAPIVDAITPGGSFDDVTAALASVGLGSVPSWLRPFSVLSNGEKFRANLARLVCERPAAVVVDEFTSVVDRQIAKIGAGAFAKAWRRGTGRVVILTCHHDVLDWLQPDWVFDTGTGKFTGRCLWRRPEIKLEIVETDWRYWPRFEPHHYLKVPHMIAAKCYVGFVEGEPVAHLAVSPWLHHGNAMRACRMVVMPEWQGAGVGLRFLDAVCEHYRGRKHRYKIPCATYFHTSHPGLAAALRRRKGWQQVSGALFGASKSRCAASLKKSGCEVGSGYGGHFRAIQGFKYTGK